MPSLTGVFAGATLAPDWLIVDAPEFGVTPASVNVGATAITSDRAKSVKYLMAGPMLWLSNAAGLTGLASEKSPQRIRSFCGNVKNLDEMQKAGLRPALRCPKRVAAYFFTGAASSLLCTIFL